MSDSLVNGAADSSARKARLEELLAELMRADDAGICVDPDPWIADHPEFAAELTAYFARQEQVRQLVRPMREAAANALHVRCPHCRQPIELVDDALLSDISCSSCGKSFSLVGLQGDLALPGDKLVGHFELIECVGVGQFGTVWKARDENLDRTVAVKLPRGGQLNEKETALFLRDARAAAQLQHPNIAGVHEVGREEEALYIVSDFIEGMTLKDWLVQQRPTSRHAAELCATIAKALHHAHEAGVIHRDLKPGNIMMDAAGEPHLVDFGLAKREASEVTMTLDGQILGTPAYMSPEQARGEGHSVDRRADVYSLGVVLFEMLTGELPFRGDRPMLIVQILNDEPPSPRHLNNAVPRDLETICLKCLEKDPGKRYESAIELHEELERFTQHRPIKTRPLSRIARAARWCRRNPLAATLGGVIGVAAACAAGMVIALLYKQNLEVVNRRLHEALASEQVALESEREALAVARLAKDTADRERASAKEAAALSRRYHYVSQIKLAQLALAEERPRDAFLALNQLIPAGDAPDQRGFEWFYLWDKCHGPKLTLRENGAVRRIAVSPDGRLFAVEHAGGKVIVRRFSDGSELDRFELTDELLDLAFSEDSTGVLMADGDGRAVQWSAEDAQLETIMELHKSLAVARFARTGQVLAVVEVGSNDIAVYDCRTGATHFVRRFTRDHLALATLFDTDKQGDRFVTAFGGETWVVDGASIDKLRHLKLGKHAQVGSVAISDDGARIVAGQTNRAGTRGIEERFVAKVWDASNGAQIGSDLSHAGPIELIDVSQDLKLIATASADRSIKLWDLSALDRPKNSFFSEPSFSAILFGDASFSAMTFDPAARHILAGSDDGVLRVWEIDSQSDPIKLESKQSGKVGEAVFLNDGQAIVAGGEKGLSVWNIGTGHRSATINPPLGEYRRVEYRLAVTPDQKTVSRGSNLIALPKLDTAVSRDGWFGADRTRWINDVAFNRHGSRIAIAKPSGVLVGDLKSGEVVRRFNFEDGGGSWATSVAFSPSDDTILAAKGGVDGPPDSTRGKVRSWSQESGAPLREYEGHRQSVWRIAFDKDGKRIAAATGNYISRVPDNYVMVWDAHTARVIHRFQGHRECVFDVEFSPDATRLASVSGYRGTHHKRRNYPGELKLWDLQTGQELLTIENPDAGFLSVAFDETGRQLAAGASDGTVTVFRPGFTP